MNVETLLETYFKFFLHVSMFLLCFTAVDFFFLMLGYDGNLMLPFKIHLNIKLTFQDDYLEVIK